MFANSDIGSNKKSVAEVSFKAALFLAGLSLLGYIPYKYATQLHAITGLYAFLFPLSSLVALAGVALAVNPKRMLDLPLFVRAGLASVAALWMITGLLCVPSLVEKTIAAPPAGLFAVFHMAAQHLFLSLGVIAFVLGPNVARKHGWFSYKRLFPSKHTA